jgi:hypothetical protein
VEPFQGRDSSASWQPETTWKLVILWGPPCLSAVLLPYFSSAKEDWKLRKL